MKTTLLLLSLICYPVLSQPPGTKINGPVTVCDSITLKEGDLIELGTGSDPRTGDFVFVYQPQHISGVQKHGLPSVQSGLSYPINSFREVKNKYSRKVIATIVIAPFTKVIELESAIRAKEIVAVNGVRL